MDNNNSFSRRRFVAGAAAAAGGAFLGQTGRAESPQSAPMNIDTLKRACKGVVAAAGEPDFEERVYGGLWNRLVPNRAPQIAVCAADEQDVIAAIQFARENKLKVVVRGGGHNWCQPTLRNGGLLIDLKNLDKVISIDVAARKAVVQPIISNREIQRVLNAKGLAYPSGHCPQVKLSGYLLGGGMSWNQGVWGYGNESVEAVELVTAEGKLITANENDNADYFWAARGAGYGFFGVATRFHLQLYPLPKGHPWDQLLLFLGRGAHRSRMARRDRQQAVAQHRTQLFPPHGSARVEGQSCAERRQSLPGLGDSLCGFGGGREGRFGAFEWLSRNWKMPVANISPARRLRRAVRRLRRDLAGGDAQPRESHFFQLQSR